MVKHNYEHCQRCERGMKEVIFKYTYGYNNVYGTWFLTDQK